MGLFGCRGAGKAVILGAFASNDMFKLRINITQVEHDRNVTIINRDGHGVA